MKVVNLPAVANLELEDIFPAYTGMPPQKIENGGDVVALRGTEVAYRVKPTMSAPGWTRAARPEATSELKTEATARSIGSFKITEDGFYHVELDGPRVST